MHYYLAVFCLAVYSSSLWPTLPGLLVAGVLWLACLVIAILGRRWTYVLFAAATGILWATCWGHWTLAGVLPLTADKTDYVVVGVVRGLPEPGRRSTQFIFEVDSVQPATAVLPDGQLPHPLPRMPPVRRLQLNWYGADAVQPGQRWQFLVRLRSPRGFVNPGGLDYRAWLLRRGISATGYVRESRQTMLLGDTKRYGVDRFRQRIRESIKGLDIADAGKYLLLALTIGDKQGLSSDIWQNTRITGTVHLLIVSGLHIGMAATAGMLFGSALWVVLSVAGLNVTRMQIRAGFAWLAAATYVAMAGFTLPTQRALVMISVVLLAIVLRRAVRPWLVLIWALTLQALIDPLAGLSPGFWLSYGAVAAFIWYFSSRSRLSWVQNLVRAQALMLVMLAGVLSYFQGNIALMAPLVNLFAIPWLSIFVVPLALLGVLIFPFSAVTASDVWRLAAQQLSGFDWLLAKLAHYGSASVWQVVTDQHVLVAVAAIVAGTFLLLPRGLGIRPVAPILMAALLFVQPAKLPMLRVTILDVGQGLSVVVETQQGVMVYDAGPKYSEHFDAGSAIVAPYLRYRGIRSVDLLVVSHSDADHSGGVAGLMSQFAAHRVLAGQAGGVAAQQAEPCRAGMSWQWGEVGFEVIHPDEGVQYADNNTSCVIVVRLADQTVLLTGDIDASTETKLLQAGRLPAHVALVVAPHHGSKSSSGSAFVAAVAPEHVVYSAGFHHHFGHPHEVVVRRYAALNARQWRTGESGSLSFNWDNINTVRVTSEREKVRRYWLESF